MTSVEQLAAARALLRWSPEDLAKAAGVSVVSVHAVEAQSGPLPDTTTTRAIVNALSAAGVLLFSEGLVDGGPGVRLIAKPSATIDVNEAETVQYREFFENDAPPGAGG
ncbi:helix-turn-helix domain-containing protein [Rhizobium sp. YTU87027]|uniref:helix-turn-helix domain-containing protein n=1 Tax=Rhizobium sp. YTU87027 TaxID=3417741 RepID=UPI003D6983DC